MPLCYVDATSDVLSLHKRSELFHIYSPAATSTLSLGSSFCDVYASGVLYAAVMQFDDGCDVLKSVRIGENLPKTHL
jgi:hypothetical protein